MTDEDNFRSALLATIREDIAPVSQLTGRPDINFDEIASGQQGDQVDRIGRWLLSGPVAAFRHEVNIASAYPRA